MPGADWPALCAYWSQTHYLKPDFLATCDPASLVLSRYKYKPTVALLFLVPHLEAYGFNGKHLPSFFRCSWVQIQFQQSSMRHVGVKPKWMRQITACHGGTHLGQLPFRPTYKSQKRHFHQPGYMDELRPLAACRLDYLHCELGLSPHVHWTLHKPAPNTPSRLPAGPDCPGFLGALMQQGAYVTLPSLLSLVHL